ncbi:MAG: DNA polymerase III subunit gamma/tau [Candidatus Sericytochromatia bacterium]|nr:DNA polymerase III subunit gamma/tau [Candidatus Sericytochromatia bacterium]
MARHEALYRKYRPQTFGDLEGQDPISRTLRNEIRQGRLTHAYLFTGPRGTGKTTTARLLAKALNCVGGPAEEREDRDPCGRCSACRAIEDKAHLDVIEIDAASNRGIENIQELQQRSRLAPLQGAAKVFIIDEVHMLTDAAWNALLKTLEEPPPHCTFVLATTEVHKVLPTVVSRCQRFDFRRIPLKDLTARLEHVASCEGIVPDAPALAELARRADGGLRDGLSLLEQVAATVEPDAAGLRHLSARDVSEALGLVSEDTVLALGECLLDGDAVGAMDAARQILAAGHDHRAVLRELLAWTRDLVLLRVAGDALDVAVRGDAVVARLRAQAARAPESVTDAYLTILRETDGIMRGTPQWQVWLEVALLRMTRPLAGAAPAAGEDRGVPSAVVTTLESRLAAMERRLAALGATHASGGVAPSPATEPTPATPLPPGPVAGAASGSSAAPSLPSPPLPGDEGGAFGEALRQDRAQATPAPVVPPAAVPARPPALPPSVAAAAAPPATPAPQGEDVRALVGDAIRRGMPRRRSEMLLGSLHAAVWDAAANRIVVTLDKELDAYKKGEPGRIELEGVIRGSFRPDTSLELQALGRGRGPQARPAASSRPAAPPGAATGFPSIPASPPPGLVAHASPPPSQAPAPPSVQPSTPEPGPLEDEAWYAPLPEGPPPEEEDGGRSPHQGGPDEAAPRPVLEGEVGNQPASPATDPGTDPEATVTLAADIFLGRIIRG